MHLIVDDGVDFRPAKEHTGEERARDHGDLTDVLGEPGGEQDDDDGRGDHALTHRRAGRPVRERRQDEQSNDEGDDEEEGNPSDDLQYLCRATASVAAVDGEGDEEGQDQDHKDVVDHGCRENRDALAPLQDA